MYLPQAPLSYMKHAMGMQNIEGFRDQRRVGMKSEAFVGGGLALHWKLTNTQRWEPCLVSLTQMQVIKTREMQTETKQDTGKDLQGAAVAWWQDLYQECP